MYLLILGAYYVLVTWDNWQTKLKFTLFLATVLTNKMVILIFAVYQSYMHLYTIVWSFSFIGCFLSTFWQWFRTNIHLNGVLWMFYSNYTCSRNQSLLEHTPGIYIIWYITGTCTQFTVYMFWIVKHPISIGLVLWMQHLFLSIDVFW